MRIAAHLRKSQSCFPKNRGYSEHGWNNYKSRRRVVKIKKRGDAPARNFAPTFVRICSTLLGYFFAYRLAFKSACITMVFLQKEPENKERGWQLAAPSDELPRLQQFPGHEILHGCLGIQTGITGWRQQHINIIESHGSKRQCKKIRGESSDGSPPRIRASYLLRASSCSPSSEGASP